MLQRIKKQAAQAQADIGKGIKGGAAPAPADEEMQLALASTKEILAVVMREREQLTTKAALLQEHIISLTSDAPEATAALVTPGRSTVRPAGARSSR